MPQNNLIPEKLKISIVNYLCGKWDKCDSDILTSWLEKDSKNRHLFRQLVDLWESDQIVKREKDYNPDAAWVRLESKMNKSTNLNNRVTKTQRFFRYAAIFILIFFMGGVGHYMLQTYPESTFNSSKIVEYKIPYGSKANLKLADGTSVWLNAGTILKFNLGFGSENRDIELSGEAYFEVTKNKQLPFVVKAKDISVKALGTKFNVKAYPEDKTIETILLEGSVNIKNHNVGMQKSIILKPDQKAVFYPDYNNFEVSVIDNISEVSWFTDRWTIKNIHMDEMAELLERRYNVDITFNDEDIKNYEFGGIIKYESLEQVLTAITYSAPLKYKIVNNHVTLSIDESKLSKYKTILK